MLPIVWADEARGDLLGIVLYRVEQDVIEVLRVLHARQQFPE